MAQVSDTLAPQLTAQDVTIEYEAEDGTGVLACDNLSLDIGRGECLALVGPSGCGKTSFLYAVDGLVPIRSGEIRIHDRPIHGPGKDRAMVFQQATLFPWRSVMGNVLYGLSGTDQAVAEQRGLDLLKLVGLAGFERHRPHQLSGGMQQRVNLARALAVEPDLLLLDEPFSALDAQTRELMQEELLRIWRDRNQHGEKNLSMLFVTHDIGEAVFLADRVVVLTARPARIREIVPVTIPRPRRLSAKRTPDFVEYVEHIWTLLHKED